MTAQISDPFIWDGAEWNLIGADDIYALFDPEQYGLHPCAMSTANYKGFIVIFRVAGKSIFLDELHINCRPEEGLFSALKPEEYSESNHKTLYPLLNGVSAVRGDDRYMVYKSIDMQLFYSGRISIGRSELPQMFESAFRPHHSYEETALLTFENGVLLESIIEHHEPEGLWF